VIATTREILVYIFSKQQLTAVAHAAKHAIVAHAAEYTAEHIQQHTMQ